MADTFNPTAVKGDTITFSMVLTGPTGALYNLTGTTFSMQVRKSYHPSGLLTSYELYVPANAPYTPVDGITGGLAIDITQGMLYVTIGSEYTKSFSDYSPSFYDIQLDYPNSGGRVTLLRGSIDILPDVTQNT
jgi:hypothetical protein